MKTYDLNEVKENDNYNDSSSNLFDQKHGFAIVLTRVLALFFCVIGIIILFISIGFFLYIVVAHIKQGENLYIFLDAAGTITASNYLDWSYKNISSIIVFMGIPCFIISFILFRFSRKMIKKNKEK